jgi:hypothetical protein
MNMIRAWVSTMQYLQDIINPTTADDERDCCNRGVPVERLGYTDRIIWP